MMGITKFFLDLDLAPTAFCAHKAVQTSIMQPHHKYLVYHNLGNQTRPLVLMKRPGPGKETAVADRQF